MLERDHIIPDRARTDHERNLMKIATRGGKWPILHCEQALLHGPSVIVIVTQYFC